VNGPEISVAGVGDGTVATRSGSDPVRVVATTMIAASPIAAATASAPIFLFLDDRRCCSSCSCHASTSGSICFVVISNTSLNSGMWTS
jgi:hypothetical protein